MESHPIWTANHTAIFCYVQLSWIQILIPTAEYRKGIHFEFLNKPFRDKNQPFLIILAIFSNFKWIIKTTNNLSQQDCIPVGCVPPAHWRYLPACSVPGGAWSGGCLLLGGLVSQHALRQTPPVNRITHACENITLPQFCCRRWKCLFDNINAISRPVGAPSPFIHRLHYSFMWSTFGLCIANVEWSRTSNEILTIFIFGIWYTIELLFSFISRSFDCFWLCFSFLAWRKYVKTSTCPEEMVFV